ncbi:CDP-alcohol phosphatidyltransferase family protein [Candidatus Margulisiibacteriota bacterium]
MTELIKKNIPNAITIIRLLIIFVIFILFPIIQLSQKIIIISLYFLFSILDFFDGWLARKLDSVTKLGEILDPLVDKISILILLPLFQKKLITILPVSIILVCELIIFFLVITSVKLKDPLKVKRLGKLKIFVLMTLVLLLLIKIPVIDQSSYVPSFLTSIYGNIENYVSTVPNGLIPILIWAAVLMSYFSMALYLRDFLTKVDKV